LTDKTPTVKEGFVRFVFTMCIFGSVLAIIAYGSYEAFHNANGFKNEYLKFGIMVIAIVTEAIGVHVVITAIKHRVEVGEKFVLSNSFGLHSCNADPDHCFKINNVPLPICARHLGMYGSLFCFAIFTLLAYELIFSLGASLNWNVHLAIFLILLATVVIEGGLGKAGIIKQRNVLRCFNGSMTIFGWLFFAFFFSRLFGLL
jgi:uncharacterized membrane protein